MKRLIAYMLLLAATSYGAAEIARANNPWQRHDRQSLSA
jgi:hypothetical protein